MDSRASTTSGGPGPVEPDAQRKLSGQRSKWADEDSATTIADGVRRQLRSCADVTGLTDPKRMIPIVSWLPQYDKIKLIGDVIAGLTVGLMLIPQGMAYGSLAGLPPIYGLYSSFMGVFVYAIFGTSKDIAVGPTALMSLIVAEAFTELEHPPDGFDNPCSDIQSYDYCCKDGAEYACTPVRLTVAATLVAGLFQAALGLLNFGAIVNFVGKPVFGGFTTAAAITIFTSQIRHILGVSDVDRRFVFAVRDLVTKLPDTRWQDFVMGVLCMAIAHTLKKVKEAYNDRRNFSRREHAVWLIGTARNAVIVALGIIVARVVAATDAGDRAFRLVRDVPAGVPNPKDPLDGVGGDDLNEVMMASVIISILGYLESVAIAKAFGAKNGYEVDATQEMRAVGYANVVSSFFLSYPVTGGFSRSAVQAASNVATPLGGAFAGLVVVVALEVATPAFFYIPKASLAAIIMMSVLHLVDVREVRRIARTNPQDFVVWLTSFLACLLWSLEFGILLAIGVSVCLSLYNESNQPFSRLAWDKDDRAWETRHDVGTDGLPKAWVPPFVEGATAAEPLVVKVEGNVSFITANALRDRMSAISREWQSEDEVRAVVVNMSAVVRLDYSGVSALRSVLQEMKPARRKVVARGAEAATAKNGEARTRKRGEIYTKNARGILIYLTNVGDQPLRALRAAGLMKGELRYGQWPLTVHASIDEAIAATPKDFRTVDACYPFDWVVPGKLAKFFPAGTVEVGRGEEPPRLWKCHELRPGVKVWACLACSEQGAAEAREELAAACISQTSTV